MTAASTLLRPSPVDSAKRGELSSATHRMYAPARQSACCSDTSVGVSSSTMPAWYWTAWPYSWASTIVTPMSPWASCSAGNNSPRSHPMVWSSWQKPAFTIPYVLSPQNSVSSNPLASQENTSSTGWNSPSNDSPYAPSQNSSMSLIAWRPSSSISPSSVPSTTRVGPAGSDRRPVGPSVAGIPATLKGSSNTETALPCKVVLHDVTSSADDTAITAHTRCRRVIHAAFQGQPAARAASAWS